jgi:hypothetical protein
VEVFSQAITKRAEVRTPEVPQTTRNLPRHNKLLEKRKESDSAINEGVHSSKMLLQQLGGSSSLAMSKAKIDGGSNSELMHMEGMGSGENTVRSEMPLGWINSDLETKNVVLPINKNDSPPSKFSSKQIMLNKAQKKSSTELTERASSSRPNFQVFKSALPQYNSLDKFSRSLQRPLEKNFGRQAPPAQHPPATLSFQRGMMNHVACSRKIKKLEKQLNNTKIFMNMVIHDMRNPTNSIEFAIKEVLKMLQQAEYHAPPSELPRDASQSPASHIRQLPSGHGSIPKALQVQSCRTAADFALPEVGQLSMLRQNVSSTQQ